MKLWKDLSYFERNQLKQYWHEAGKDYSKKLEETYFCWNNQNSEKHNNAFVENTFPQCQLPQSPGYYLWYEIDLHSIEVGLVKINMDSDKHIEYLKKEQIENPERSKKSFYIYEVDNKILTLYYNGITHPYINENNTPKPDGFMPLDMSTIFINVYPTQNS